MCMFAAEGQMQHYLNTFDCSVFDFILHYLINQVSVLNV